MEVGSPEFEQAFLADCKRQKGRRVHLDIDFSMALVVVGQLQLALRHPNNTGPSAANARAFVHKLIARLAVTDTIGRCLQTGFDPKYDQDRPFTRHGEPTCPKPTPPA